MPSVHDPRRCAHRNGDTMCRTPAGRCDAGSDESVRHRYGIPRSGEIDNERRIYATRTTARVGGSIDWRGPPDDGGLRIELL